MENEVYAMPRIGDKAPEFEATTTQGPIRFPAIYKGKWVILFSHPADFTSVCTSELMLFGSMQKEFESLNCQLVGLSVGAVSSHIAWLRTIRERIEYKGIKHLDIQFPLIADVTMEIARCYGMIQPGESTTAAVRAVFFIDPTGTIRAIVYYPLALGRNFDELRRVLIALQTIDAFEVALPADWHPGDEVIVPAGTTKSAADSSMQQSPSGTHCYDWFFCTKPLAKVEIEACIRHQEEPA